jgi:predicted YcjX-like family ATPase
MAKLFDRAQETVRKARRTLRRAPERLAQQLAFRADIAVTGLRRAGKTVFITSTIHNLLSASRNRDVLAGFDAARRMVGAREVHSSVDIPVFPTQDYLRALAEDRHWPQPTAAVSMTELAIRYRRTSFAKHLPSMAEGIATIGFFDYPGEWLLDIPMIDQSYADWSRQTLELLRSEPRLAVAREFLDFEASCDLRQTAETAADTIRKGHDLYRRALHRARDELSLCFLQPGRFVLPDDMGDRPALWFFPSRASPAVPGSISALMAERFEAYCQRIVKPFFVETFERSNRQVVLVDLIAALNAGRFAFEDTSRAIDAVLEALQVGRRGWISRLFPRRFDKILFAATKADHVPDVQRDRLRDLLASMTGIRADRAVVAGAKEMTAALASIRCTVDEHVQLEIGEVDVVVGTPVGQDRRVKVYPGTIPKTPPPASYWTDRRIAFPQFKPPPISIYPGSGIPHIGLDGALHFLLDDQLR